MGPNYPWTAKEPETNRDDGWKNRFPNCQGYHRRYNGMMRKAGEKGTAHLRTFCHSQKANKRKPGKAPRFFAGIKCSCAGQNCRPAGATAPEGRKGSPCQGRQGCPVSVTPPTKIYRHPCGFVFYHPQYDVVYQKRERFFSDFLFLSAVVPEEILCYNVCN